METVNKQVPDTKMILQSQYQNVFDPRILTDNESKQLWTSKSVELAERGLAEGYKLIESPYNSRIKKAKLRRANLPFEYTEEELLIIEECINDKIFFADHFAKLKDGDKGWSNIVLRNYQKDILNAYTKNRNNILMVARQSGKTTTTIIEIVHYATFNYDKDIVVIAQSEAVVSEILEKIRFCFEGLPFFIQPGFLKFTDEGFELDNGCRCKIAIASESATQGFSLDLLFIDEFAYIPNSVAEKFWVNVYPTLTNNPKSRCIIASTPNGRNLFYELWTKAINKQNSFVPFRLYWYEVPGRDEKFKERTISDIGLMGWEMGYECSFDVGMKSIFGTKTQKELRQIQNDNQTNWINLDEYQSKKEQRPELSNLSLLQYQLLLNGFVVDITKQLYKNEFYLMSIDIAEGLEQDYSVIKLIKIDWNVKTKRLEYTVVATFRNNTISVEALSTLVLKLSKQFETDNLKIVVENNNYGGEFFAIVDNLRRYNRNYSEFDNSLFAVFNRESKGYERGIRWNGKNKPIAVKNYSTLVTKSIFNDSYSLSIEEGLNFCRKNNDTFSANYGHDDLVMANITATHYIKSTDLKAIEYFKSVENKLRIRLNDEPIEVVQKRLEEQKKEAQIYVTPTGFRERTYVRKTVDKNLLLL